ncbi:putative secreted protein (Por secretion system target) [Pontibacter ummariensis]|uniref:Por secretion system C-terminal sorting domain-containing protein n=1 Tax=Pontibacter ummariensis TaxID=1610492 RepID=A0A239GDZ6_9BACT|nr:T9SS type A sorting domain-containing protein [Pontibacter ummariensis]PRY11209.1 putative secreted protein (Por secretion system target) [Pontibacter ummariensis]SNS67125.1 Por secretion system C-terminal sorting domain-containing protein [Pontibacter ummariensis]
MSTTIPLNLFLQLALALLLALMPLFKLMAQPGEARAEKIITIKVKQDKNGQVQLLDTTLTIPNGVTVHEAVESMMGNSEVAARFKNFSYRLQADSLRSSDIRTLSFQRFGDTTKVLSPVAITIKGDDARAFSTKPGADGLKTVKIGDIESIVVLKTATTVNLDSIIAAHPTAVKVKITRDEKTGESKIIRIDENGREEEIQNHLLPAKPGERNSLIIINRKVEVKEISPEDKKLLKEAGAAIETKKNETLELEHISFYPNPNDGRFNLRFAPDNKGTTRVSVMDSRGEEVFVDTVEQLSGEYNRQIDLTPFGPGIYYLQIMQGKRYHTKKILVK